MDWVAELCQKFEQVRGGCADVAVSFAERADMIGELGRSFNALAEALPAAPASRLTREQAHGLCNHLAGIMAALHVLAEDAGLNAGQQAQLREVVGQARELEAALRRRTN